METLKPNTAAELAKLLAGAHERGERVSSFDLGALNRLLEHKVEDMTSTVEAGMSLAELQRELDKRGQWLPVDAPNGERLSIGALLATNASGPRRFGFGTVRDYLLGMTAVLADGRVIHAGGKVVKNVAGYDLMKLFIGSRGSLGAIVEATFKVLPRPETEQFVEVNCDSAGQADQFLEAVLNSELTPVVLDLHRGLLDSRLLLVVGFAGTRDEVEWQVSRAGELGIHRPSSLEYNRKFFEVTKPVQTLSVLPSKVCQAVDGLNGAPFVARAGNGIIYHFAPLAPRHQERPTRLEQRLKDEFDPKHILPEVPA
jgi:FAD/FMN-containing dehydrogenase